MSDTKKRGGTRSIEERVEAIDKAIGFHQEKIDLLNAKKDKILNPTPRTRTRLPKVSDEDRHLLELIKKSGKSMNELLAKLSD